MQPYLSVSVKIQRKLFVISPVLQTPKRHVSDRSIGPRNVRKNPQYFSEHGSTNFGNKRFRTKIPKMHCLSASMTNVHHKGTPVFGGRLPFSAKTRLFYGENASTPHFLIDYSRIFSSLHKNHLQKSRILSSRTLAKQCWNHFVFYECVYQRGKRCQKQHFFFQNEFTRDKWIIYSSFRLKYQVFDAPYALQRFFFYNRQNPNDMTKVSELLKIKPGRLGGSLFRTLGQF